MMRGGAPQQLGALDLISRIGTFLPAQPPDPTTQAAAAGAVPAPTEEDLQPVAQQLQAKVRVGVALSHIALSCSASVCF